MGNTIVGFRPIQYGPHEIRNERTEARILFLEDPANDGKPLPTNLFMDYQIQMVNEIGRREYAAKLREQLLGHVQH